MIFLNFSSNRFRAVEIGAQVRLSGHQSAFSWLLSALGTQPHLVFDTHVFTEKLAHL